jgi:glycosyltransferase involved in cell wall biosynthesis
MLGARRGYQRMPAFVWSMRRLIRHSATHIVAVSEAALQSVLPAPWQAGGNCTVIYSGLPMDAFHAVPERHQVRAEFGWPADSRVAINVARFFEQKNHPTIVESFRLAHAQDPRLRLLLVGDGKDKEEIERLVRSHGLDGVCAFAGVRKDVPRLLLASDLFFFPSLWEGLPGALLEALAAGLPVVTSDIAPMQEVARHFATAMWVAEPRDDAAHAGHIAAVLAKSYDRVAAQQHFERSPFTMDYVVQAYSRLYGVA